MKFCTHRTETVMRTKEHEGDYKVAKKIVHRTRVNQRSTSFRTCAFCLKKIDQNGETLVQVIQMNSPHFFYEFHDACWGLAQTTKNPTEKLWKDWTLEDWQNAVYCDVCGLPMLEIVESPDPEHYIGHYQCVFCTWKEDESHVGKVA